MSGQVEHWLNKKIKHMAFSYQPEFMKMVTTASVMSHHISTISVSREKQRMQVYQIHRLAFVGQDECERAVEYMEEEAKKVRKRGLGLKMMPLPLYAGLPYANQMQVFESAPRGYRKVNADLLYTQHQTQSSLLILLMRRGFSRFLRDDVFALW